MRPLLHVATWLLLGLPLLTLGEIGVEWLLGTVLWLALFYYLRREERSVQISVGALIALATLAEHVLTHGVGAYQYRFGQVPWYVPPGHGLVYWACLRAGLSKELPHEMLRRIALALLVGWVGWNLAHGTDTLGAAFALLLVYGMYRGRGWPVYVYCFYMTTLLELWGTSLGLWTWAPAIGVMSLANPPAGVAGAYASGDSLARRLYHRWSARKLLLRGRCRVGPGRGAETGCEGV